MKSYLLNKIITVLVSLLDEELVKKALDKAFDYIENEVKSSETEYDDVLLLPVISALRKALKVN